jgi:hypothetical protein
MFVNVVNSHGLQITCAWNYLQTSNGQRIPLKVFEFTTKFIFSQRCPFQDIDRSSPNIYLIKWVIYVSEESIIILTYLLVFLK